MRTLSFWLALVLIFAIPWENLVQFSGLGTVSRLIGLLTAAAWFATVLIDGRFRKLRVFHFLVILFIAWNAASLFWTIDMDKTLSRSITYLQNFIMILILWDIFTSLGALRAGLQAYVLGAYVSIANLMGNYLAGSVATYQRYSAWGFNSNDLGFIIALGMPIAWYLAFFDRSGKKDYGLKWINYGYILIATFAILLTSSRSAVFAALPTFLFILASLEKINLYRRITLAIILIGSLSALLVIAPPASLERIATTHTEFTEGDLNGRLDVWKEGVSIFFAQPLFGVGSGTFNSAATETGKAAHNFALSLLAELGIIGCGLFIAILLLTTYYAIRQPRWRSRLWLTILLIWFINAAGHNLEQRKQTWLFLGLIVVSAYLPTRPKEGIA